MTALITNHLGTHTALESGDYAEFCSIAGQLYNDYTLFNYQGIMGETSAYIILNTKIYKCREDGTVDLVIPRKIYEKWRRNRWVAVPYSKLSDEDSEELRACIRTAFDSQYRGQKFNTWKFRKSSRHVRIKWRGLRLKVESFRPNASYYTNYCKIIVV